MSRYIVGITDRGYHVSRVLSCSLEDAKAETLAERREKPWLGSIVFRDGATGKRYSIAEMEAGS